MTAPVRIEAEAWSDLRFATLARLLGLADLEHALIKTARIWSWQTEHYTPDAPTYVVDGDLIESALGPGGAAAMVRARLAEEVPAEAGTYAGSNPGGFRIRGSIGRIEWLWQRREASARGGEARKRSARNKDRPGGSGPGLPAADPGLMPGPEPKPSPLVPAPDLPEEDLPPARDPSPLEAAPEQTLRASPPPAPAPILASSVVRADARRQLIGWAWQLAGDTFRELGREGIEPGAFDPWAGTPNACDEGMKLLIAHVDRLLIGDPPDVERARAVFERRIAVAKAEGRAASPPTRRWLTPMRLWNAESFAKGAEMSPEQVRPKATAPRRGDSPPPAPAPQRPERPPPDPVISPEERAERAEMAKRLAANPDAAAAAELERGRIPAHMSTAELHKRFGDGQRAPPQGVLPDDETPDEKPRRRKAAT